MGRWNDEWDAILAGVFVLQHVHSMGDDVEDVKFIGVFSSREKAQAAVARLGRADGFHIDEYRVDQDQWVEGYATLSGA